MLTALIVEDEPLMREYQFAVQIYLQYMTSGSPPHVQKMGGGDGTAE